MTIEDIKGLCLKCEGMRAQLSNTVKELEGVKSMLLGELGLVEKSQTFLQTVAQETQELLRFQIEDVVNLALETCFPGEYSFKIDFRISRGKTEANPVFVDKKTGREIDPMNASGGGVVDLATFALRVACYALERGANNVMILDEPFRFLSRDLQSRAGEILRTLSEKMDMQVIMVTHISDMIEAADNVIVVSKNADGKSKIACKERVNNV